MSVIDATQPLGEFKGDRYEIVSWARGQRVLYYAEFGSYSGQWLLMSASDEDYYIYKGWFGSCGGCDAYEAKFAYGVITFVDAQEFADEYDPFLIVPKDTMHNICEAGKLLEIIPANIRSESYEIDFDAIAMDCTAVIKMDAGMLLTTDEILAISNTEIQHRALVYYGYEWFMESANAETIDRVGHNKLIKVGSIVMLDVRDSTSAKRYLLRVPPEMKRVKQALAWTFNMPEEKYDPLIET